jgi:hypothetical protein
MCDLARIHWRMQVEVSLEVVTLDVSTSLTVALDGGATVLPTSMVVYFLPEVRHLVDGHWHAVLRRRARTGGACATDGARASDRKRDCCTNGELMAVMTSWSTS